MNSTNETIAGCGFHHVAIRVADWDASVRFYCEGLGFKTKLQWGEAPARAAMLDTGDGNYLEIFERTSPPDPATIGTAEPNILHLCFRADDCAAAVEKARAAGAKVTVEPKQPEPFTKIGLTAIIAFVQGPDGEIVEFFQSDGL
jgi:glyoxylase I family protein